MEEYSRLAMRIVKASFTVGNEEIVLRLNFIKCNKKK